VLDIGCGGGLLSEALAQRGADVTAIDLAPELVKVARLHALESGAQVDYRVQAAEDLAAEQPGSFDVVTCMEMLEHVPDPGAIIEACKRLLKPGGHLFLSTINRTAAAFAVAIVGAEYVARLLPRARTYQEVHQAGRLARWLPRPTCSWWMSAAWPTSRGATSPPEQPHRHQPGLRGQAGMTAARARVRCCSTWTAPCWTARRTSSPPATRCWPSVVVPPSIRRCCARWSPRARARWSGPPRTWMPLRGCTDSRNSCSATKR
jgi:SAM-dependent methyltransferase